MVQEGQKVKVKVLPGGRLMDAEVIGLEEDDSYTILIHEDGFFEGLWTVEPDNRIFSSAGNLDSELLGEVIVEG